MNIDPALLIIALISLVIVSITLVYVILLHRSSKSVSSHLDNVLDNYLKNDDDG